MENRKEIELIEKIDNLASRYSFVSEFEIESFNLPQEKSFISDSTKLLKDYSMENALLFSRFIAKYWKIDVNEYSDVMEDINYTSEELYELFLKSLEK